MTSATSFCTCSAPKPESCTTWSISGPTPPASTGSRSSSNRIDARHGGYYPFSREAQPSVIAHNLGNAHGWLGKPTDIQAGPLQNFIFYPWYCHAIRGHISFSQSMDVEQCKANNGRIFVLAADCAEFSLWTLCLCGSSFRLFVKQWAAVEKQRA